VIIGSTRQGRFSEKPAQWIFQQFRKREGIEARLLDLRDFPMPFFDQPMPPAMPGRPTYEHDVVKRLTCPSPIMRPNLRPVAPESYEEEPDDLRYHNVHVTMLHAGWLT
jgi:hypothetical protein